jgi:hypothetical protein
MADAPQHVRWLADVRSSDVAEVGHVAAAEALETRA